MTKISFPKDGVYRYCEMHFETCKRELDGAISNCVFDIPNGFDYRNYLSSLGSVLDAYKRRMISLNNKLKTSDSKLIELSNNLEDSAKKLEVTKVRDRERLIK